jgi:hypothetical protein
MVLLSLVVRSIEPGTKNKFSADFINPSLFSPENGLVMRLLASKKKIKKKCEISMIFLILVEDIHWRTK